MTLPQKPDYPNFKKTFRGGCDTVRDPSLLEPGDFSYIQNMRWLHPGMKTRPGQIALHSVPDGGNRVETLHQFSKGRITERHLFAQMSDGRVLEATNNPPTVTVGAFGSAVFTGSASGQAPASWATIGDKLLYANGVDQHQIFAGNEQPVGAFVVYKGTGTIPSIPDIGEDYSSEIRDNGSDTAAVLDNLSTLANFDCIFVMTDVRAKAFNFTFKSGSTNGNNAVLAANYRKSNNTWAALAGLSDGTNVGGVSGFQNGKVSFTAPTDDISKYMFGRCGFWYQFYLSSGSFDADTKLQYITYDADWQGLENVWDGVPVDAIEVQVYKAATGTYSTFAASSVDITGLTTGDKIFFSSLDLIEGAYIDVGETPSLAAVTLALSGHNGAAFASVGAIEDASAGITQTGWITFTRMAAFPIQFNRTRYYAYWYCIDITGTITDDNSGNYIAIKTMPYFNIREYGKSICNMAWKGRAVYVFDQFPNTLHISAKGAPMVLNGSDYAILEAGDGRFNRITCLHKFHNEFKCWQEEKGVEGGCLTLFEGYSPATYGKLCLSSRIGSFNAKSAVICDGVMTSTSTDEEIKTLSFALSHDGVCMSDGKTVRVISDQIQNYFDPTKPECIRRGYEDRMWLAYDKAFNVLRIGLVSGTSAAECNVFPVYDLVDKVWSFDSFAQPLACMAQVEAAAGGSHIIQVAGGTNDGTVYLSNSSTKDVAVDIDSYAMMEIDGKCDVISVTEIILRLKRGSGAATVTVYEDGVAQSYSKEILA